MQSKNINLFNLGYIIFVGKNILRRNLLKQKLMNFPFKVHTRKLSILYFNIYYDLWTYSIISNVYRVGIILIFTINTLVYSFAIRGSFFFCKRALNHRKTFPLMYIFNLIVFATKMSPHEACIHEGYFYKMLCADIPS